MFSTQPENEPNLYLYLIKQSHREKNEIQHVEVNQCVCPLVVPNATYFQYSLLFRVFESRLGNLENNVSTMPPPPKHPLSKKDKKARRLGNM